ncbi:MAG: HAMP domain-containing histidine kinase [Solirubrobacterales bacterium]|nr:HAMP domain-containing histidine kinase [Solirubrobacterales bacterium]
MIGRSSVRWRLVAWVTGVLVVVLAVTFAVVYEQTGSQLRAQVDADVGGDVSQLSQAVRGLGPESATALVTDTDRYVRGQPFSGSSSLLFAVVDGHGTVSNHPEFFGASHPDNGESAATQRQENAEGQALLTAKTGLSTHQVPDVGEVRVDERLLTVNGISVRVGAGEPLTVVTRAQHSVARSFLIAGALALALALLASYLAGASVSLPLRRMAKVAARVSEGDLAVRMRAPSSAGEEIHVLAESFNDMLDRLTEAFAAQREFVADASHELRTPLTVIAGQMEVLAAQRSPDPDEIRRVGRLVAAEIARTSRLVDDMLVLARSERQDFLQREPIELGPFVIDLWSSTSLNLERRFELGPIPEGVLVADPDRLAQALRNLIRNAVEHTTEPDGLVRLELAAQPGAAVRFIVLDDGPGIEPEQLERVFERFHRTDRARTRSSGGAGLGLAIVQAIAEAHGGRAYAESNELGGANVVLEIPGPLRPRRRPADPLSGVTVVAAADRSPALPGDVEDHQGDR